MAEIRSHGYALTPGRYVGARATEDDGESLEQRMAHLVATREGQFAERAAGSGDQGEPAGAGL